MPFYRDRPRNLTETINRTYLPQEAERRARRERDAFDARLEDRVLGGGDRYGQLPTRRPDSVVGGAVYDAVNRERNRAQEQLFNADLPGEDAYYKRQYGDVARILQARQEAANSDMRESLASRGMLDSSLVGSGMADINRQYGSELRGALGNIQDARFAARERRIEGMQNRGFQREQSQKNFEYQLYLLREQLKRQGRSDILPYVEQIFGSLVDSLGSGGTRESSPYDVTGSSPYDVTGSSPYEPEWY